MRDSRRKQAVEQAAKGAPDGLRQGRGHGNAQLDSIRDVVLD